MELLEEDREFRNAVAELIGYQTVIEKLAEHDREFNEIIGRLVGLRAGPRGLA